MEKESPPEKSVEDTRSGLLRTTDTRKGFHKAAQFILLLEKPIAAKVLSHLNESEVEGIIREIVAIRNVSPREAERVAREYGIPPSTAAVDAPIAGGFVKATEILAAAVGQERSQVILGKVEEKLGPGLFAFLHEVDEEDVFSLLSDESSQVIALVLTQLPAGLSSKLLIKFSVDVQKEVAGRIAKMEKVLPEIMRRTADTLKKKLFSRQDLSTRQIDGKKALQNILKHMKFGEERDIIDSLSETKPELAEELEKSLFTLEILGKIPEKQLQVFLRALTDHSVAMILKGEAEEFKKLVLAAVSERRRTLIMEEYQLIGEIPKKEADKEKQEVLVHLKSLIEQGKMTVLEETDHIIF